MMIEPSQGRRGREPGAEGGLGWWGWEPGAEGGGGRHPDPARARASSPLDPVTERWGPHLPRAGWASRRTPETSPSAWPAAPCPTWGCRTGAPGACGSANKGQLQSPSLRARPVKLGPAPPQTRGSLRQDPLLHDVVQGGEDALPHVALQRRVEVGNDLEGKAGRTVSAAPPRGPSDSTTGRTGRPCPLQAAEPGTCCSSGRRAAEEPRRDADTAGQRGETPGLVEGRGGPFTARRSGGHAPSPGQPGAGGSGGGTYAAHEVQERGGDGRVGLHGVVHDQDGWLCGRAPGGLLQSRRPAPQPPIPTGQTPKEATPKKAGSPRPPSSLARGREAG